MTMTSWTSAMLQSSAGCSGTSLPSDPRADINNDNEVDILDLVLMGGNYTKTSQLPWS
nr:hypothetical protein [Chloroflexota bacterium]